MIPRAPPTAVWSWSVFGGRKMQTPNDRKGAGLQGLWGLRDEERESNRKKSRQKEVSADFVSRRLNADLKTQTEEDKRFNAEGAKGAEKKRRGEEEGTVHGHPGSPTVHGEAHSLSTLLSLFFLSAPFASSALNIFCFSSTVFLHAALSRPNPLPFDEIRLALSNDARSGKRHGALDTAVLHP